MNQKRIVRMFTMLCVLTLFEAFMAIPASATAAGNVSGAIEGTWNAAKGQVQTIVNNVVFPVIDMILAVLLFVKIATAYMDYRKHGQLSSLRRRFCLPACCSPSPHPAISGASSADGR